MDDGTGARERSLLDHRPGAVDHRYREACRMMERDDHLLGDIAITREELPKEFGIDQLHGTSARPLGRRETSYWSSSANVRMARGVL